MDIVWMFLTGLLAFGKGRNVFAWIVVGYFAGIIGMLVLMMLPKKITYFEKPENLEKLHAYFAKKQFKKANTVDDLFKQLETK